MNSFHSAYNRDFERRKTSLPSGTSRTRLLSDFLFYLPSRTFRSISFFSEGGERGEEEENEKERWNKNGVEKKRNEMATNDKKRMRGTEETVNCDSLSMSYCPAL